MKLNGDKCHLINFGKGSNDTTLKIDNTIIKPSKEQKLLGTSIDNNLSFKGHVQSICKKASQNYMPYPESPITWMIDKLNRTCTSSFYHNLATAL